MLPDKIEHCIVFMNYWDVSGDADGVFWSFSKCNIKIPHLPADPSTLDTPNSHSALKSQSPHTSVLRYVRGQSVT